MWGRARNRGLGARGWGQGGYLKLFTSDCGRHIAVGRDGGCGGEAMMGVRRVVGKGGWGEALIKILNKTGIITLSLVIGMHITGRNRPKSRFQGGFPIFGRESPYYDIIISQKRHVLAPKKVRK